MHGGAARGKGSECAQEKLFYWSTVNAAVSVVCIRDSAVSGITVAIRRLCVAEIQHTLFEARSPVWRSDKINSTGRNETSDVNEAVRLLPSSMSDNLSELISKNSLYGFCNAWPGLAESGSERGRLPLMFVTFTEFVTKALNIVQPQQPQMRVTELDEEENVLTRLNLLPALKTCY